MVKSFACSAKSHELDYDSQVGKSTFQKTFMSKLPAGCRSGEMLNRQSLVSVWQVKDLTLGDRDDLGVDIQSDHLIITSASGSWSYKLTNLQTQ